MQDIVGSSTAVAQVRQIEKGHEFAKNRVSG